MYNKYICQYCGAHLDPGEPCDCRDNIDSRKRGLQNEEDCSDQLKRRCRKDDDDAEHGI